MKSNKSKPKDPISEKANKLILDKLKEFPLNENSFNWSDHIHITHHIGYKGFNIFHMQHHIINAFEDKIEKRLKKHMLKQAKKEKKIITKALEQPIQKTEQPKRKMKI